jgi:hypothetical protein
MAPSQYDENYRTKVVVMKVSLSRQLVWRTELNIGDNGTQAWAINEDAEGTFMITGQCLLNGSVQLQPFAARLDRNGNIMWTKVYSIKLAGYLSSSVQMPDGSYIFGGCTNGFGNGTTGLDVFTLRTDKDGNLK